MNRYFILYELEDERVVGGPDYLARLNAPTPWSQRIMPRLGNFARGGGRIAASRHRPGRHRRSPAPRRRAVLGRSRTRRGIGPSRPHHRRTGPAHRIAQTSIKTREKGMRANDGSFAALLLIEGLDETACATRSITCAKRFLPSITTSSTVWRSTSSRSACRNDYCPADDGVLRTVGWVERSETHHNERSCRRRVSLRCTHPTFLTNVECAR